MDIKKELRRLGETQPALLLEKLKTLDMSEKELIIMKFRYIDGLEFKQIPIKVGVSMRWVYKLHSRAIKKTLDSLKLNISLTLDIHK
ncbi:MAG: hypothetical protein ACI4OE_07065 [Alphaproteobacteria bacterium]